MELVHWSVRFLYFNNGVTAGPLRAIGAMNNLRDVIVPKLKTFLNDLVSSGREHATELQQQRVYCVSIESHLNHRNQLSVPRSLPGNQPFAFMFLSLSPILNIPRWHRRHNLSWPICCFFAGVFHCSTCVCDSAAPASICLRLRCSCLCLSALLCE